MRRNISNVGLLCVIGAPLFESTLAQRRSIAFRNSTGTWSRAPGKQFGVLDRWRDRHTRPARWSDTLRIRPVRWRKWNRIRIDLARLADPMGAMASQITSLAIVYSTVYSGAGQSKHWSSASPVTGEFPAQRPVTRKLFPFDDVIMDYLQQICTRVCFDSFRLLWYKLWFHIMHFPLSFLVACDWTKYV